MQSKKDAPLRKTKDAPLRKEKDVPLPEEPKQRLIILPRVDHDKPPMDPVTARRCLQLEKRVLRATFAVGLFATVLFLVALCAENWVKVEYTISVYKNDSERNISFYKTGHYQGLWRICRQEYYNATVRSNLRTKAIRDEHCVALHTYLAEANKDGNLDTITHYRRSCCAIGVLGLLISTVAHFSTGYSLCHIRYIYKRLAGVLHLITGACCWVTVEVFKRSMQYERLYLQNWVPPDATIGYGFAYFLGWLCFGFFVVTGIILLICSRKRKGARARSMREAAENEPVNIGRI